MINPPERTIDGANTIGPRWLRSFFEQCSPPDDCLLGIRVARAAHAEEGEAPVDTCVDARGSGPLRPVHAHGRAQKSQRPGLDDDSGGSCRRSLRILFLPRTVTIESGTASPTLLVGYRTKWTTMYCVLR